MLGLVLTSNFSENRQHAMFPPIQDLARAFSKKLREHKGTSVTYLVGGLSCSLAKQGRKQEAAPLEGQSLKLFPPSSQPEMRSDTNTSMPTVMWDLMSEPPLFSLLQSFPLRSPQNIFKSFPRTSSPRAIWRTCACVTAV